jgi:formylglycine-generating enzyme required for sulfatase activity
MRIFLSAVSAQFQECREALASDLRAIGCEVRVQEDLQQGPRTLIERLEEYVAQCDRVIALVGDAFGAEATGDAVPAAGPPRSYTQWEYAFATGERLAGASAEPQDLYVYLASDVFLASNPVEQTGEAGRRQANFVRSIKDSGKHWTAFDNLDQLCRRVLRDGWQMDQRPTPPEDEPPELIALRKALAARPDAMPPLDAESLQAILRHQPGTLDTYRVARVAEWSQERYALDGQFTRLTLLLDQGPDAQGARWQPQARPFQDLRNVLAEVREPALVLLGPPGCGKSTLLRRLELDISVDALRSASAGAPVSVFLPLNRYRPARPGEALPAPEEWLAREWAGRYPRLPAFTDLLRTGRLVLLLDAVNEMPHAGDADYRDRIALWRNFLADLAHRGPGTRAVFSCRSLDYSAPLSAPELPVPHVRIEQLADEQVAEFLALHSPEQGPSLWRQLRGTPQLDLFRSPFYLKLLLAQADGGAPPAGHAALFTGFLRQALAREIENGNRLFLLDPILQRRDREQILRREWRGPYDLPARGRLVPALCDLAFGLQQRRGAGEVSRVRAREEEALALVGGGEHADDLLHAGVDLQALERQWDDVFFTHQLQQEYFAARAVAWPASHSHTSGASPRPELVRTAWRSADMSPSLDAVLGTLADSDPLPQAPATGWEETFLLAAAMARDADSFLAAVADANLPLAGRCAARPEVSVSEPLRQRLQQALVERSRDPAADLRARIAAARALGELGDPRFERRRGPDGEYLVPPLVAIEGGVNRIGSDEGVQQDEAPAHPVTLAPFAMGQFPVTNAEWRLFQESGGYEDERWWDTAAARAWRRGEGTAEGPKQRARELRQQWQANPGQISRLRDAGQITSVDAELSESLVRMSDATFEEVIETWYPAGRQTQPEQGVDPAFNHPAQPVVGVCWYEARAYCAWLSAQSGQTYRLPTEVEWEAAARGRPARASWFAWLWARGAGRSYAWPGDFDPARCNVFETHVRGTTPPGVFPGGDTPEGLVDMTGNVWEWTTSAHRPYPHRPDDGREDPEVADVRRVVRGGSWNYTRDIARSAYRLKSHPDFRSNDLGFRVVCGPPFPESLITVPDFQRPARA